MGSGSNANRIDKQQRIIAVGDLYQQQTIKQWIIISKNGDE